MANTNSAVNGPSSEGGGFQTRLYESYFLFAFFALLYLKICAARANGSSTERGFSNPREFADKNVRAPLDSELGELRVSAVKSLFLLWLRLCRAKLFVISYFRFIAQ